MEKNQEYEYFFNLWSKYEDITNQFSALIIQIRTKALALITAISSAITVFAKNTDGVNWELLFVSFLFLSFFWISIWILDLGYYNEMLKSSVKALKKLEESAPEIKDDIKPSLSSFIDAEVGGTISVKYFYSVVMMVLTVASLVSAHNVYCG
ncbi:hypothetical protein [Marinomonas mediterranea]|jgi:hypothetical protein|uniref:SMODS and SLOG-associating 2TM effector domain-containing protein n=1 Tax=Marinomonas mediterranea (strain ATCC 700492 / JCM 21426 / NBRC 103028 / MMB-1) TaxID=717774 RepID=F2JZ33_MARM1|nr:hypothetical protein [Marinomonas mediterranea]ADZ92011.1 hypothetical protein Marme_2786 [Marinomonas mediterranea MMB-1]WCN18086.1 hypothetical protein GV053_14065 [Marinomonas mediterranea MMB-1]